MSPDVAPPLPVKVFSSRPRCSSVLQRASTARSSAALKGRARPCKRGGGGGRSTAESPMRCQDALNYQHKAFKMTKEPLPTSFYTLYFSGFQHRGLELSRRPGDKCEGPRLVKEGKKV